MSKSLSARVRDLANRQSTKSSATINQNLDLAHSRLVAASRRGKHYNLLRTVSEDALRNLAASLGLECWSDDDGELRILSITGKILVIDIGLDIKTNEVKSCTLVLASDDGLQDESVVDGRDIMFPDLRDGRLDSFSRSLAKLAFLDRRSDQSIGLNLFQAQEVLREAINKKFAHKTAILDLPIPSPSLLSVAMIYQTARRHGEAKESSAQVKDSTVGQDYRLTFEIEEQPVSARFNRATIDAFTADELAQKPVFRYPKAWVDGHSSWLPMIQYGAARYVEDLRYTAVCDPPIVLMKSAYESLSRGFPSRMETASEANQAEAYRAIHTPSGIQYCQSSIHFDEDVVSLRRIAFGHPKELEQILSIVKQFAVCQQLQESLRSRQQQAISGAATVVLAFRISMVDDLATAIDGRKAIQMSIYRDRESTILATIKIQPDGSVKCWHRWNQAFFGEAISLIKDVAVALIATESRPKQTSPAADVEVKAESDEFLDRMDFRRDPNDPAARTLSASEAKQGYLYTVPVDPKIEMKSNSAANAGSPGYLAALGTFMRTHGEE